MANRADQPCKQVEITATYSDDTKNFHRFDIDEAQGVKGMIYILKGDEIPDSVTIHLRTKAEAEAEKKG